MYNYDMILSSRTDFWRFIKTAQYNNEFYKIKNLYIWNPNLFNYLLKEYRFELKLNHWMKVFNINEIISIFNYLSKDIYIIDKLIREIINYEIPFKNKLLKVVTNNIMQYHFNTYFYNGFFYTLLSIYEICPNIKFININNINLYYKYIFNDCTTNVTRLLSLLTRIDDIIPKWCEKLLIKLLLKDKHKIKYYRGEVLKLIDNINFYDKKSLIMFIKLI